MMSVEVVAGSELAPDLLGRWIDLQAADARFASPFFRPEFTQAVAARRDDIFVGVLSDRSAVRGFIPFQRAGGRRGGPVGGMMSNYQGVIVESDADWNPRDLVRDLGLSVLRFDHLICSEPEFAPFRSKVVGSQIVDTADGFHNWLAHRRAAGVSTMTKLPRKIRKLDRELGPIRFEPHVACNDVFTALVGWKRAQYTRTHARGSLAFDWAVQAAGRIAETQEDGFAGMLSALYAGDRLVAAHLGMRSRSVWHHWYPAYDPAFAVHSPGLILLWKMIHWAAESGIDWIDLGIGGERWKSSFATREVDVAEADVYVRSPSGIAHSARAHASRRLRSTPLLDPARRVFRAARGVIQPIDTSG